MIPPLQEVQSQQQELQRPVPTDSGAGAVFGQTYARAAHARATSVSGPMAGRHGASSCSIPGAGPLQAPPGFGGYSGSGGNSGSGGRTGGGAAAGAAHPRSSLVRPVTPRYPQPSTGPPVQPALGPLPGRGPASTDPTPTHPSACAPSIEHCGFDCNVLVPLKDPSTAPAVASVASRPGGVSAAVQVSPSVLVLPSML